MPSTSDHDHDRPLDISGVGSVHTDQSGVTMPATPLEHEFDTPGAGALAYAGDRADAAAVPPPPPPSASADEKEHYWLQHVYQGDRMPQLTLRAVLMGGGLGMFLAISNLYTTIKLGWGFLVGITACVLSYAIWNTVRAASGNRVSPMSILENNCMQSTATCAGATTGNTVAVAFGAVLLTTGEHVPWYYVMPFVFLTAALGCFLAIPVKRQLINIEQLPFPSGIAAAETLRSLHSHGKAATRKAIALISGLSSGALIGLLRGPENALATLDRLYKFAHIPELIAFGAALNPLAARGLTVKGLGFEPGGLMIAAGAFVGLRVSLSMLASSVLVYYVLTPWLLRHDEVMAGAPGYHAALEIVNGAVDPRKWSLWAGTAVIVVSSLVSLGTQWRTMARVFLSFGKSQPDTGAAPGDCSVANIRARMERIEVPFRWLVMGVIPIGIGMVIVNYLAFKMSLLLGIIAVAMSFLSALVCARASGETDIVPMSAVGKLTQLLYAVLARGNTTINLMSAGVTAASGASAADLLTDLKAGYLLGANPRKQFLAQFFGVFFGAIVVVPAWFLMVPNKAAFEAFNPPGPKLWQAMAELLAKGLDTLPTTALPAVAVAALIGAALPLIPALFPKAERYMPSAMGLGLGFVVPFFNSLSFALGAVLGWVWLRGHKRTADAYTFPIAAGLIAGESIVLALIAMAVTASSLIWPK